MAAGLPEMISRDYSALLRVTPSHRPQPPPLSPSAQQNATGVRTVRQRRHRSLSVLRALHSRSHVHHVLAVLPVLAGKPGWGEGLHGASGQVTTKRSCCGSRQTAARSAGCGPRPSGTCPKARSSTRTVGAATSSSPSARPAPPRPAPLLHPRALASRACVRAPPKRRPITRSSARPAHPTLWRRPHGVRRVWFRRKCCMHGPKGHSQH